MLLVETDQPLNDLHELVGRYFAGISHFLKYCLHLLWADLVLHSNVFNHLLQIHQRNMITCFVLFGSLDEVLFES